MHLVTDTIPQDLHGSNVEIKEIKKNLNISNNAHVTPLAI